jgi:hypothetical protein
MNTPKDIDRIKVSFPKRKKIFDPNPDFPIQEAKRFTLKNGRPLSKGWL